MITSTFTNHCTSLFFQLNLAITPLLPLLLLPLNPRLPPPPLPHPRSPPMLLLPPPGVSRDCSVFSAVWVVVRAALVPVAPDWVTSSEVLREVQLAVPVERELATPSGLSGVSAEEPVELVELVTPSGLSAVSAEEPVVLVGSPTPSGLLAAAPAVVPELVDSATFSEGLEVSVERKRTSWRRGEMWRISQKTRRRRRTRNEGVLTHRSHTHIRDTPCGLFSL
ncbi:hypothetical protein CDEST_15094 [Colletotrichum destructivum]|uniref:Uncharacterized protein n=1 Tax=Colletotrichum destructivum TaxID=34406 RepID=A0AAX4J410_9PEZI|nr:hypothetical protein CDEST_15094 [Colletotrichum destructivum]